MVGREGEGERRSEWVKEDGGRERREKERYEWDEGKSREGEEREREMYNVKGKAMDLNEYRVQTR